MPRRPSDARPRRRARPLIKVDVPTIRNEQRKAALDAITRATHPVERLRTAVAIFKDANKILAGDPEDPEGAESTEETDVVRRRNTALMSLTFYSGLEGLVAVAGISSPTYDAMRREALGLSKGADIPSWDAGEAAARNAGITELPEAKAIADLEETVPLIVGAQERRKLARLFRQDGILEVSKLGWDDEALAAECGISTHRVRGDKSAARSRLQKPKS